MIFGYRLMMIILVMFFFGHPLFLGWYCFFLWCDGKGSGQAGRFGTRTGLSRIGDGSNGMCTHRYGSSIVFRTIGDTISSTWITIESIWGILFTSYNLIIEYKLDTFGSFGCTFFRYGTHS
jgi:hypothetical protein